FCSKKFRKNIHFDGINPWRRTVSGNLTAAFSAFGKGNDRNLSFVKRDQFIETIYNAKFRAEPAGFKKVNLSDLKKGNYSPWLPQQEKGARPSCAIPYELYATGRFNPANKQFGIRLEASRNQFGDKAAGAPFRVYAIGKHKALSPKESYELNRSWNYTVAAGHLLEDQWALDDFESGRYHLRVYAPNGFYREFKGNKNDPAIELA